MQRYKRKTGAKFNYHVITMRYVCDPCTIGRSQLNLARSEIEWVRQHGGTWQDQVYVRHLLDEAKRHLGLAHNAPPMRLP